ncbi:hypothetical protein FA13DRAFT_1733255 [Coprinellus micaceus]|uniref:Uncharacterized protein n=1 Tax=Coprinellus micaceus TaxID=71717 RepID=A0A4Y7T9K4_COPMI|nr:hypothetical protein FA13DRAFT_1733255 [Coprinellus micaceus]
MPLGSCHHIMSDAPLRKCNPLSFKLPQELVNLVMNQFKRSRREPTREIISLAISLDVET